METDSVKDMLRTRGYAESLEVLFRDPLINQNRHINRNARPEDYRLLWNENVDLLRHLENAPEVEKVRSSGDSGISEDDWEKTKAMLEQSLPGERE